MTPWNQHSNVADVLGLGPRIAGRLLRLGIRTAEQLIEVCPERLATKLQDERFSPESVAAWQREVELRIAIPDLPAEAVRVLAAVGYGSSQKLSQATPTELLAEVEFTLKEHRHVLWLAEMTPPTVAEVAGWIHSAHQQTDHHAA